MMMKTQLFTIAACALLALTHTSHASVYTDAVLADSPLYYWNFDEVSGNAIELVDGGAADELVPTNGAGRAASTTTNGGVTLGSAASFDGVNDYFRAANLTNQAGNNFIPSQRWALEFWFNTNSTTANQYITNAANAGDNDPAVIYGFVDGNLELFDASGDRVGTAVSSGTWHHAVLAFYGNNSGFADNLREFYIDGVLANSSTTDAFSSGFGLGEFFVGAATIAGANSFNGLIDELALYELGPAGGSPDLTADRARVADIAQHFNVVPAPAALPAGLALIGMIVMRRR